MEHERTIQPDETDELLSVLADQRRRTVLEYLLDDSRERAGLEELADEVASRGHREAAGARVELHHSALPKLAAAGVVDYDPERRVVRYRGHPLLETLLEAAGTADRRSF